MSDNLRERMAQCIADGQAHPSFPRPADVVPNLSDYRAADRLLAAGIGDVSTERERADALQARIDAVKALLDETYNGSTHWEWIEGGLGGPLAEELRAALVSEEPAPEDHSSHEFCDRRLGCLLSEPAPEPSQGNAKLSQNSAPEPPKLDPFAWVLPDGGRTRHGLTYGIVCRFAPRPEFEQDRAKYEEQS